MAKGLYTTFFERKHKPHLNQSSYSGCDIIPVAYGRNETTGEYELFVLGNIQTITYSIHRNKGGVFTLGRSNVKGVTRGNRTIAGSLIFTVFDRRALWELSKNPKDGSRRVSLADSLPPFDILLYFTNEYGKESTMVIQGIDIIDEGESHSIEDLYMENTMSFIARDINLLEPKDITFPGKAIFSASETSSRKDLAPGGVKFNYSYF